MTYNIFHADEFSVIVERQSLCNRFTNCVGMVSEPHRVFTEGTDLTELMSEVMAESNLGTAYFVRCNKNPDKRALFYPNSHLILQYTTCIALHAGETQDDEEDFGAFLEELYALFGVILELKDSPVAVAFEGRSRLYLLYQCLASPEIPDRAAYAEYIQRMLRRVMPYLEYSPSSPFVGHDWVISAN